MQFGDVLFALVNYARFVNVDPEQALEKTNKKFIRRFLLWSESSMFALSAFCPRGIAPSVHPLFVSAFPATLRTPCCLFFLPFISVHI